MGFCLLVCATGTTAYPLEYNLMFYNAVTGQTMHFEEMMKIGERIYNLKKAFNIKHGATKDEDSLPERILMESHAEGDSKGSVCKLGEMLPEYYKLRGGIKARVNLQGKDWKNLIFMVLQPIYGVTKNLSRWN